LKKLPKGWFDNRGDAQRWAFLLSLIGIVPLAVGAALYWLHVGIQPSTRGASWFTGLALVGTLAVVILGILRTIHPAHGLDKGMKKGEAILLQLAMGLFVGLLLVFLPH
jgi:hypothetical protein